MILKSDLIIFEQFCKKRKVKLGTKASYGYSKNKSAIGGRGETSENWTTSILRNPSKRTERRKKIE
jgi:hypothetical protein